MADGAQIVMQGSSSAVSGQITETCASSKPAQSEQESVHECRRRGHGADRPERTTSTITRTATNAQIRVKALVGAMKPPNALGTVSMIDQNYSWGIDMEKATATTPARAGLRSWKRPRTTSTGPGLLRRT
ncbi:hypothetical protein ACU4GD_29955 [Cupriavidus basilensis]